MRELYAWFFPPALQSSTVVTRPITRLTKFDCGYKTNKERPAACIFWMSENFMPSPLSEAQPVSVLLAATSGNAPKCFFPFVAISSHFQNLSCLFAVSGHCIQDMLALSLIGIQYPLYKRWGSVAELTCHLQGSTPCGIRFSHKTYRPAPTKDVTLKDPPLISGPLIGKYCYSLIRGSLIGTCTRL
jgi:hypothetical protein